MPGIFFDVALIDGYRAYRSLDNLKINGVNVNPVEDEFISAYAEQGIGFEEAIRHMTSLAKFGAVGVDAARQGLTVEEAASITKVANGSKLQDLNMSGAARIAAERYMAGLKRYNNDGKKALNYARQGLAEARKYSGPSQDNTAIDNPYTKNEVTAYIDTFRDQVEAKRIDGLTGDVLYEAPAIPKVAGIPQNAALSAGASNYYAQASVPQRQTQTVKEQQAHTPFVDLDGNPMVVSKEEAKVNLFPDTTKPFDLTQPQKQGTRFSDLVKGWGLGGQPSLLGRNDNAQQNVQPSPPKDPLTDITKTAPIQARTQAQLGINRDIGAQKREAAAAQKAQADAQAAQAEAAQQAAQKEEVAVSAQVSAPTKVEKLGDSATGAPSLSGKPQTVGVAAVDLLGDNQVSEAASAQAGQQAVAVRANRAAADSRSSRDGGSADGASKESSGASHGSPNTTFGGKSAFDASGNLTRDAQRNGYYDSTGTFQSAVHRNGISKMQVGRTQQGQAYSTWDVALGIVSVDKDGRASSSRVICTELVRQGLMASSLQRLDIAYTLKHLSPATVRGYHAWAVPYVRLMKRSKLATRLVEPFARWRAEEIAYQMKGRPRPHYRGKLVRLIGEPMCWGLGTVLGWTGDPNRFYPGVKQG